MIRPPSQGGGIGKPIHWKKNTHTMAEARTKQAILMMMICMKKKKVALMKAISASQEGRKKKIPVHE